MEISKYKVQMRYFDKVKTYLDIDDINEWMKQMDRRQKIEVKNTTKAR